MDGSFSFGKNFELPGKNMKNLTIPNLFVLALICFYPSSPATGPLFTYLFVNASNNVDWANNIEPSTGPNPTINSDQGSCSDTIAFIDSQTCVLSNQGIFLAHGTSITTTSIVSGLPISDFADHNVITLLLRKYINLDTAIYVKNGKVYPTYFTLSFPEGKSVMFSDAYETKASKPDPLSAGFSIVAFVGDASTTEFFLTEPSTSNFRITSSTWMDISITYEYVKNAPGIISFQVKFYSLGAAYSMASTNTANNNPNFVIGGSLETATININNDHAYDFTLQYLSIYGGAQTIDYISTSFCPVTNLVPPEYCANTQVSFLLSMCTSAVGETCVSDCFIQSIGQCSKIITTKTQNYNYTHPLSNTQIVAVIIGVSIGVDATLVGIYILLTIFCFNNKIF